jgi:hypothetical protein
MISREITISNCVTLGYSISTMVHHPAKKSAIEGIFVQKVDFIHDCILEGFGVTERLFPASADLQTICSDHFFRGIREKVDF